ncbi:MAG: metallophosphoesterase family protein [Novosphingobium sp.]
MIDAFRKFFRPQPERPQPAVPPGERVYAVGDVHGCRKLFDALIEAIERDDSCREQAHTTIVLLGDLIDRGEDSAGVIASARALATRRETHVLCGNHEEMLLRSLDDLDVLRRFLRFGGRETILSYPIDRRAWDEATLEEAQRMMHDAILPEDLSYIRRFEDWFVCGDYLFVHAGVEPGVPLEQQKHEHLRWIREPFLSSSVDNGHVVVHGHTIVEEPAVRHNRIGIDTGAYMSGRLTALALEGSDRWLIEAAQVDEEIVTGSRPV